MGSRLVVTLQDRIAELESVLEAYRDPNTAGHTVDEEFCGVYVNVLGVKRDIRCVTCLEADRLLTRSK